MNIEKEKVFEEAIKDIRKRQNIEASLQVLHELADFEGYLPAIACLGVYYGDRVDFLKHDIAKSDLYLKQASIAGDNYARHVLGSNKWSRGLVEEAVDLFEIGAKLNYLPSIYRLAWAMEHSQVSSRNYKRSLQLYESAAKQGHVGALGSYIARLLKFKYGCFKIVIVPFLLFVLLFRVIKFRLNDPDHCLVD